eukprot:753030-Hanusia_phi.AAC.2
MSMYCPATRWEAVRHVPASDVSSARARGWRRRDRTPAARPQSLGTHGLSSWGPRCASTSHASVSPLLSASCNRPGNGGEEPWACASRADSKRPP